MDDVCISCCKIVRPRQEALCCDRCNRWQHRTCGTGISRALYRQTCKGNGIDVWMCRTCSYSEDDENTSTSDLESESSYSVTEDDVHTQQSFQDHIAHVINSTFITDENRNNSEVLDREVNVTFDVPRAEVERGQEIMEDSEVLDQELNVSFDVPRAEVQTDQEIMEDSLQDPELPFEVLPDGPITYSIIEGGTQRNATKLISSDGYEYTKKTSKGDFTYWRCIKRSKNSNCPATVSQKGNNFKANAR